MTTSSRNCSDVYTAARQLEAGGLVAIPTETVYGLAADATSDAAVAEIFATKGRPQFNPLIVHVRDAEHAGEYVDISADALLLMGHFWPGPLTLVLPRKQGSALSLLVSAGLDTVAVRAPAHPLAQALLRECSKPLAAPSANRSGRISPSRAEHVYEEFAGRISVLDGGACVVGVESTVLDMTTQIPTILRHGAVLKDMLEEVIGTVQEVAGQSFSGGQKSPGMMESHYAPVLPVRLNAQDVQPGEALLAFGAQLLQCSGQVLNLSPGGSVQEAAANLFSHMRQLDNTNSRAIAVMPIPETGLGVAINDRLRRAAAPRS